MLPDLKINGPVPPIAHLDQYGGLWSIEPQHARSLVGSINNLNLDVHVAAHQEETAANAKAVDFQTIDTGDERVIAVVSVNGVMTKYGSSMSSQGSTVRARRELRRAAQDERVIGILLKIDSPGGSVAGTPDLALDVAAAAQQKPVYAYCEDCCCSAAYYVASQATKVFANANAMVGSIGVYLVVDDYSKAFADAGIQTHVIKFGEHKADGTLGTEITDEMLDRWQELINTAGEQFVAAVQKGRALTKSEARALATGDVWVGQQAVDIKLIDKVQSLDKTLADLAKAKHHAGAKSPSAHDPLLALSVDNESAESSDTHPHSHSEETEMAKTPTTATADTSTTATYKQIAEGCKGFDKECGDDAKFAGSCLERELTIAQSKDEWSETLSARIEAREEENAKLKEAAAKSPPAAKSAGNKPLKDGDGDASASAAGGDPIAEWTALLKEHADAGLDKSRAVRKAVVENPDLHEQYLEAHKSRMKQNRD